MPFDDVVDMITTSINEDAECQHEAITQLTSANKEEADKTHLIDIWLKKKSHYCLQLEKVNMISKFLIISCIFDYFMYISKSYLVCVQGVFRSDIQYYMGIT